MRVALLTEGPEHVASTYWRGLQHIPRLALLGIELEPLMPRRVDRRTAGPVGTAVYFGEHALRYGAMGVRLRASLGKYDAVLVQRGAYPMGPAWIVEALRHFGGRVVLDLDDNVFVTSPNLATRSRAARWLYGPQQARYLVDRADAIIVSTPILAQSLPGRRADAILPTVPDVSRYPTIIHRNEQPIRVGWAGNAGNLLYLDPLRDVFARLRREAVAEVEVLCSEPWSGPAGFRQWRRTDEVDAHATYDVGIMPLPDTPYTRAKAGFKLLMYMGVGSAVVASPVGVNATLLAESGGGLAATTPVDWEDALRTLATDPALRRRLGQAGQSFTRTYADLDRQAAVIAQHLRGPRE